MISMMIATSIAALAAPHADRDTVARIDRAYQAAVKRNDAKAMARILHPEFQLVMGDGRRFDRDDLLTDASTRRFIYEQQDEEPGSQLVQVWGDTAIVTAKLRVKARTSDQTIDRILWFSDTYVRTDGGWKYLFGQASLPLPGRHSPTAAHGV